jgi:hypothetical protein
MGALAPIPHRRGSDLDWRQPEHQPWPGWPLVPRLAPQLPGRPVTWAAQWAEVQEIAGQAGRDPTTLTGAMYLTLSLERDAARAEARLNAFLQSYYRGSAGELRSWQACCVGEPAGAVDWLSAYVASVRATSYCVLPATPSGSSGRWQTCERGRGDIRSPAAASNRPDQIRAENSVDLTRSQTPMHARRLTGEIDTQHAAADQIETHHVAAGRRRRHR